jgi:hypothetical protein
MIASKICRAASVVAAAVTGGSSVRPAAGTAAATTRTAGNYGTLTSLPGLVTLVPSEYLLLVQNILFAITAYLAVAHSTCVDPSFSIVLRLPAVFDGHE